LFLCLSKYLLGLLWEVNAIFFLCDPFCSLALVEPVPALEAVAFSSSDVLGRRSHGECFFILHAILNQISVKTRSSFSLTISARSATSGFLMSDNAATGSMIITAVSPLSAS